MGIREWETVVLMTKTVFKWSWDPQGKNKGKAFEGDFYKHTDGGQHFFHVSQKQWKVCKGFRKSLRWFESEKPVPQLAASPGKAMKP